MMAFLSRRTRTTTPQTRRSLAVAPATSRNASGQLPKQLRVFLKDVACCLDKILLRPAQPLLQTGAKQIFGRYPGLTSECFEAVQKLFGQRDCQRGHVTRGFSTRRHATRPSVQDCS